MKMRSVLPVVALITVIAAYVVGSNSRVALDEGLLTVASFERALNERNPLIRSYGFTGFLPALNPDNLDEVLEVLESHHQWLSRRELRHFMLAWMRFDSRGALDWALSRTGSFKEGATAAAMWAWAFDDPVAARQALEALDEADAGQVVHDEFILGWLLGGAPGAAEYIAELPGGIPRQKATSALTVALMREGPDAVIEWVEAIPDETAGNYKSVAFQKVGMILAYVDPGLASSWIEKHLDHAYSVRAVGVIGSQWADQDPETAIAWLMDLPTGEHAEKAMRSAFGTWLKRDPEAAREWLLSVAPSPGVDEAIELVVRNDRRDAPASALEWAQRIHDPTLARQLVTRTGQDWFRTDPDAVREWLSDSELPEEIQTAIQNPPKRKPVRERQSR